MRIWRRLNHAGRPAGATVQRQGGGASARVRWRLAVVLCLAALEATAFLAPIQVAGAQQPTGETSTCGQTPLPNDYPIPGGWFYTQENREAPDVPAGCVIVFPQITQPAPRARGYLVVDDQEAAFWTGFRQFGGVDVLGYPVSRRYRYPDQNGVVQQAFQRGVLQWDPAANRAVLANIFEQFTEQGLDDVLERVGIPKPRPGQQLPFAEDAERRMGWITEPRLLARYLFDPINQVPLESVPQAWVVFGLPQDFPDRPLLRDASGTVLYPLYRPYLVQRFQKGGLQLFVDDVKLDPTVVPGDARVGCVAVTASGRLARRFGAGKLMPLSATKPEPTEPNPPLRVFAITLTPTTGPAPAQQFELIGTNFEPGEAVAIRLTPLISTGGGTPITGSPMALQVDAVDPDGSFTRLVNAPIGAQVSYLVQVQGLRSGKTFPSQLLQVLSGVQSSEGQTEVLGAPGRSKALFC